MKKKKLQLKELQVESFVTNQQVHKLKTIQGEGLTLGMCETDGYICALGSVLYDCGTEGDPNAPGSDYTDITTPGRVSIVTGLPAFSILVTSAALSLATTLGGAGNTNG